ncbi:MAG: TonB-dependent receptor [Ignavibacteriales bacterium]|nr:TonB-dependent receptor [Ignavibacteriales bacterium]
MNRLLLLLLIISSTAYSQIKISGNVKDKKGDPLRSANVYLKNTYDGASTNPEGKYSFITLETGDKILIVSYVGYKAQERNINIKKEEIREDFIMEEETSSLKAVVISAGSFEASDENKAVILKPLDIVTTGTTADIYTALNTLPGAQHIGETEGLFVRGGSASETKTIIDEMIVQSPFYSTVPDVASRGRFSPFLFKGTMFSTGGYSAQYGQALSSALILKSTDLAPDTRSSINLMVVGLGGSHVQRWENTSLAFEGGYYNLSPIFKLQKQRLDWDKAPSSGEGQVIFRHKTSTTGIFKVYTSYEESYSRLYLKNLDHLELRDKYGLTNNNYFLQTSFSDVLAKEWALFAGASYSRKHDMIDLNLDKIKIDDKMLQAKLTLSRKIVDGSFITFGGEVQNLINSEGFNEYDRKLDDVYAAAFAETDIFLSNDLAARVGARMENSGIIKKFNFAPRASIAYRLGQFDQLNFAYGIFYQTPEKEFLFETRNLNYERADHYIFNYQYLGDKITFRIEGYYKQYKYLVKKSDNPAIILSNLGKGYAKGIDIFFRANGILKNGDGWISYSYLDTKREYKDYPTLAEPTFATPHTFSAVFKQFLPNLNSMLSFTYSFATGRPYFNPNNPIFLEDKTKEYNNLSINYNFFKNIFGNFTVFFVSVENILGFNNVYTYRFSTDGKVKEVVGAPVLRSVFFGMFISLGENVSGF